MKEKLFVMLLIWVGLSGCNSDNSNTPPQNQLASVTFVYSAPTALDPLVASRFPQCVSAVGRTHLHPSWRNFAATNMSAVGRDRFQLTYADVPVERDLSFRINDPNGCDTDPNGAVTINITANGVTLTRVVGTPGNGTEPGLAFRVSRTGTIIP
jgi:hypothetical protein